MASGSSDVLTSADEVKISRNSAGLASAKADIGAAGRGKPGDAAASLVRCVMLCSGKAIESLARQRDHQRGLVREVAIDRGRADTNVARHFAQRHALDVALGQQPQSGVQQRAAQIAMMIRPLIHVDTVTLFFMMTM